MGRRHSVLCGRFYPTTGDLYALFLYLFLHAAVFAAYYRSYDWENGGEYMTEDILKDIGIALGHNTHVAAALHLLPVLRNSPFWWLLRRGVGMQLSHNYVVGWHMLNGWVIFLFVTLHMVSFWADWIGKGEAMVNLTEGGGGGPPVQVNMWVHQSLTNAECWEECKQGRRAVPNTTQHTCIHTHTCIRTRTHTHTHTRNAHFPQVPR